MHAHVLGHCAVLHSEPNGIHYLSFYNVNSALTQTRGWRPWGRRKTFKLIKCLIQDYLLEVCYKMIYKM